MRLISCYIENFGGLSQFSMDFDPHLTVLQQPNGFGKTTLAEFIRAMFYGFPRKAPKQLGKRQKYRPWNGKKCCGHLTFEHEGKCYRIERSFGATPRGDSFQVIDLQTGQRTNRFPEEIGLALFGLDADSFERSTYLPQSRENGPMTTDSIRAKLGDLVEDTDDVGNYEKAVAALRAKRSSIIPYRGSGGAVAEDQARITRLQQALDTARESERALSRVSAELAARREEQTRVIETIDGTRRELTAANEAAARLVHHQNMNRMTAALAETKTELEQLQKRYPKGLPDGEDLDAVADTVEQAARLAASQPVTAEDRRAEQFVQANQARFAGGIPDAAEFDELRKTWDDRRMAEARLESCALPGDEQAELAALKDFFEPGIPAEETLRSCESALEEAARLRRENTRLAAQTVETVPCKVPSPLTVPLLLGGGVLGIIAGIVMMNSSALGGVVLVLGILALAGAGFLHLRSGMTRQVAGLSPQLQALIRENEEQAAALEAGIRAFTAQYGNVTPDEIRRRGARLTALRQRDAALAGKRWELNAQLAEFDAVLDEFFNKYHCRPARDSYDELNRFQRDCGTWQRAMEQLADREERVAAHRREAEAVQAALEDFREKYTVAPRNRGQVLALREDVRRAAELGAAEEKLNRQIAQYQKTHAEALAAAVQENEADPAALRRRESALLARQSRIAEELVRLGQQELQMRENADRIPELEDELERWQEKKLADQAGAAMLDDTVDFLARARENLSTAYMGTIRESFSALMDRMAGEDASRILVTAELEVRLERCGASRELGYFSAGQTDLVLLCMRLALVDALFRETKPFVILDDPFVNLDDDRTKEALALLRDLSCDRQIIYLVCNSSRV